MKIKKTAFKPTVIAASMIFSIATIPLIAHGQAARDVRCNGCVAASDIKNNSVAGADIKNSSLTSKDIKNSSLTGSDVKNGSITGNDLKNGSISGEKIVDGSIGFDDLASDAVYGKTIIVTPGADTTANCDALRAAFENITDNSVFNPYLIYAEPGTYDCGTTPVTMKPYVSLMGAGPASTLIFGAVDSNDQTGLLITADNTAVRSLYARNYHETSRSYAIVVDNDDSVELAHLALFADAVTDRAVALLVRFGDVSITNVIAEQGPEAPNSFAIQLWTSTARMNNVVAQSQNDTNDVAMIVGETSVIATGSKFSASAGSITAEFNSDVRFVSSELQGGVSELSGSDIRCIASFTESFSPVASDCGAAP